MRVAKYDRGIALLQSIQVVLFIAEPPSAQDIASACFPGRSRSLNLTKGGFSAVEFSGEIDEGVLSNVDLARVDIKWENTDEGRKNHPEGLSPDEFEFDFKSIADFISNLSVTRVAVVLQYWEDFTSPDNAVGAARSYNLPVDVPEGTIEFNLSFNHPKKLRLFTANRLVTLQVFWLMPFSGPTPLYHLSIGNRFQRVIDLNTPFHALLGEKQAGSALMDFYEEAKRLHADGLQAL